MRKLLIIATALLMTPGAAFGAAYMKLGDIKGEATDSKHKDWIVIESMSQGMSKPKMAATGTARQRASVVADTFVVSRKVSKASPTLARAMATGQVFPSAEFNMQVGAATYNVKLEGVTIAAYNVSGDADDRPTEEVAFYYNKITWSYSDSSGKNEASWDFKTGR